MSLQTASDPADTAPVYLDGPFDAANETDLIHLNGSFLGAFHASADDITEYTTRLRDVLADLREAGDADAIQNVCKYLDQYFGLQNQISGRSTLSWWEAVTSEPRIFPLVFQPQDLLEVDAGQRSTGPPSLSEAAADACFHRLASIHGALSNTPHTFPPDVRRCCDWIAEGYSGYIAALLDLGDPALCQSRWERALILRRHGVTLLVGLAASIHRADRTGLDKIMGGTPYITPTLNVSPCAPEDVSRVPFSAIAVRLLAQRLFDRAIDPVSVMIATNNQATCVFRVFPPGPRLQPILPALTKARADDSGLVSELAALFLLLNLHDPAGSMHLDLKSGRVQAKDVTLSMLHNIVEHTPTGKVLQWANPFLALPSILALPLHPRVRARLATFAPATTFLAWLADILHLRDDLERLMELGALNPSASDMGYDAIRQGTIIRLYRTAETLAATCRREGPLTIGDLYRQAAPTAMRMVEQLHDSMSPNQVWQTICRGHQDAAAAQGELPTTLAHQSSQNALAHDLRAEHFIPRATTTQPLLKPDALTCLCNMTTVAAVGELLFALCLDARERHPLAPYTNIQKLFMTELLSEHFSEMTLHTLPSYWNDANLFHAILQAATAEHVIGPRVLWMFRDFVNAWSDNGQTPLHQLLKRSASDDIHLVIQQINYLLDLGADIDGANSRFETPVDLAFEMNKDIFVVLVGAGACGGRKTDMLKNALLQLERNSASFNPALLKAIHTLADRNRRLNWEAALSHLLPTRLANRQSETSSLKLIAIDREERHVPEWVEHLTYQGGPRRESHLYGRRRVSIAASDGQIDLALAFKDRPEFPCLEMVAGEFSRRLFGEWLAPFANLFMVNGEVPQLISQRIRGDNLHQVLLDDALRLQLLDERYLSMAFINAMLLLLEDGKPDQYIVEQVENGLYRLVCIDNERCFCPTELSSDMQRHLKKHPALSACRPKNVLFCLPQMAARVHPEVRLQLLQLDVPQFVLMWLRKSVNIAVNAQAYFERGIDELMDHPKRPTIPAVPMRPSLALEVIQKLRWIQYTLQVLGDEATHLDLLMATEPQLGQHYQQVLHEHDLSILQRFDLADGDAFEKSTDQSGYTTRVPWDAFVALHNVFEPQFISSTVLTLTENSPLQCSENCDSLGREILNLQTIGQQRCMLTEEVRVVKSLLAVTEVEQLFANFDFRLLRDRSQRKAVLGELAKRQVRHLSIKHCCDLSDGDIPRLFHLGSLIRLDLTGCNAIQLTPRLLKALGTRCQLLRDLILAGLTRPTAFEVKTPGLDTFPSLRLLDLRGCSALQLVALRAPELIKINIGDCPNLRVVAISTPKLAQLDCEGTPLDVLKAEADLPGQSLVALAQRELRELREKNVINLFRSSVDLSEEESAPTAIDELRQNSIRFWIRNVVEPPSDRACFETMPAATKTLLKSNVQHGIPDELRGVVWLRLTGAFDLLQRDSELYTRALSQRFGGDSAHHIGNARAPHFGMWHDLTHYNLTTDQTMAYHRVLACVAQQFPHRLYSPLLPVLAAVALTCMSEAECYALCAQLVQNHSDLALTRAQTWQMVFTFDALATEILPMARSKLCSSTGFGKSSDYTEHPLRGVAGDWFANYLPLVTLQAVMDLFLVYGREALFRFGLAMLRRWGDAALRKRSQRRGGARVRKHRGTFSRNSSAMSSQLHMAIIAAAADDVDALLFEAFQFQLTPDKLSALQLEAQERAWHALSSSGRGFLGVDEAVVVTVDGVASRNSIMESSSDEAPAFEAAPWQVGDTEADMNQPEHLDDVDAKWMDDGSRGPAALTSGDATQQSLLARVRDAIKSATTMQTYSTFLSQYNYVSQSRQAEEYEIERERLQLGSKLGEGRFGMVCEGVLRPPGTEKEDDEVALSLAAATPTQMISYHNKQVYHQNLRRRLKVAVKESKTLQEDNTLMLEAQMMMSLLHPHLVALVGTCMLERPYQLVVEFMANGDLKSYLAACDSVTPKEEVDSMTILSIARQIGSAMAFLEQRSIIHRDLAARNKLTTIVGIVTDIVLVSEQGLRELKLADFGLARAMSTESGYLSSNETLPFRSLAPEVFQTQTFTSASDVWAFAVLLWECSTLAKERPYSNARNGAEVFQQLKSGFRLQRPPLCVEDIYRIMQRCWEFNPAQRPSFAVLLHEFATMTIASKGTKLLRNPTAAKRLVLNARRAREPTPPEYDNSILLESSGNGSGSEPASRVGGQEDYGRRATRVVRRRGTFVETDGQQYGEVLERLDGEGGLEVVANHGLPSDYVELTVSSGAINDLYPSSSTDPEPNTLTRESSLMRDAPLPQSDSESSDEDDAGALAGWDHLDLTSANATTVTESSNTVGRPAPTSGDGSDAGDANDDDDDASSYESAADRPVYMDVDFDVEVDADQQDVYSWSRTSTTSEYERAKDAPPLAGPVLSHVDDYKLGHQYERAMSEASTVLGEEERTPRPPAPYVSRVNKPNEMSDVLKPEKEVAPALPPRSAAMLAAAPRADDHDTDDDDDEEEDDSPYEHMLTQQLPAPPARLMEGVSTETVAASQPKPETTRRHNPYLNDVVGGQLFESILRNRERLISERRDTGESPGLTHGTYKAHRRHERQQTQLRTQVYASDEALGNERVRTYSSASRNWSITSAILDDLMRKQKTEA